MLVRRVRPSRPTYENPFADFDQVRREMLRLVDSIYGERQEGAASGVFPPVNVTHDEDRFFVRAELPGVKANELSISVHRNRLTVAGKREIPGERGEVSYHRKERPEGSFSRTVALPLEIDADRVEARYADGVLTLELPKAEAAKPRQIVVKS